MNAMEDYAEEIERIFAEAGSEIDGLPPGLRELGRTLLARCNPLAGEGGRNAIGYLLPYWVRERTGSPIALCRELAVGNILAMLHYFLLDDAMDGGKGRLAAGLRDSLALGQLLHGRFVRRYARVFPSDSALWEYNDKYTGEWASAVYGEVESPMDPHDPGPLARKAAPAKLCATALLLDAGRTAQIPEMEEAVDLALATLQLSDDWADWREDLPRQNGNGFLTVVRETLAIPSGEPLGEDAVKRAIYHRQAVDRLAGIAEGFAARLRSIPMAPASLIRFQGDIAQGIRGNALSIENATRSLADLGGLSQFL